jgi:hypothetical protein
MNTDSYYQPPDPHEHIVGCPLHEDNVPRHECRPPYLVRLDTESIVWTDVGWMLDIHRTVRCVFIKYCPWCGEELDPPTCQCDDLRERLNEAIKEVHAGCPGL